MNAKTCLRFGVTILAAAIAGIGLRAEAAEQISIAQLAEATHFHGLAVNPKDPLQLLLATHHGLFIVAADGLASRISETADDFMGFSLHPTDVDVLFSSGHPAGGGNLGLMASTDGGRSWSQVSPGAYGEVDFHQMDVSKADPQRIYGIYGELQVSRDGGKTWEELIGNAPAGVIDLAASALAADTLYAATEEGLLRSQDTGATWEPFFPTLAPASMVQTTQDGTLYAFVGGAGLVTASESLGEWTSLSADFPDRWIIHFAVDPTNADNMYAVTNASELLASHDGGRSWAPLGSQ